MPDLFVPTLVDQIACVRREIGMRERVYPRRVADGKMKPAAADRELETMCAVLATLLSIKPEGEECARDHGAVAERASIVAWLRVESKRIVLSENRLRFAAAAIERGVHTQPEPARRKDGDAG